MSHAHLSSNRQEAQEAPLPSSSFYGGLAYDEDSAFNDFQNSQLAEETSSMGPMVENNGKDMDNGEKIKRWYKDLEALALEWFEDELDEEAMQAANPVNSMGGEIAEVQTIPSTPSIPAVDRSTISNAPGSIPDLSKDVSWVLAKGRGEWHWERGYHESRAAASQEDNITKLNQV